MEPPSSYTLLFIHFLVFLILPYSMKGLSATALIPSACEIEEGLCLKHLQPQSHLLYAEPRMAAFR